MGVERASLTEPLPHGIRSKSDPPSRARLAVASGDRFARLDRAVAAWTRSAAGTTARVGGWAGGPAASRAATPPRRRCALGDSLDAFRASCYLGLALPSSSAGVLGMVGVVGTVLQVSAEWSASSATVLQVSVEWSATVSGDGVVGDGALAGAGARAAAGHVDRCRVGVADNGGQLLRIGLEDARVNDSARDQRLASRPVDVQLLRACARSGLRRLGAASESAPELGLASESAWGSASVSSMSHRRSLRHRLRPTSAPRTGNTSGSAGRRRMTGKRSCPQHLLPVRSRTRANRSLP